MSKDKSVFIRLSPDEILPSEAGNYLTTLQYPDGTLVTKKIFFTKEFKLTAGKRNAKIVNWFKRVEIPEELFKELMKYANNNTL